MFDIFAGSNDMFFVSMGLKVLMILIDCLVDISGFDGCSTHDDFWIVFLLLIV